MSPLAITITIWAFAFIGNIILLAYQSRTVWKKKKAPTGRCSICERMKRDHTKAQLKACFERFQAETAQDAGLKIPAYCPRCDTQGLLAITLACGDCGGPMETGGALLSEADG